MGEFTLKYFNQTHVFNNEIKLIDLLNDEQKEKYLCAKVNNRIQELNYTVFYDADIEFLDITDEEGMYIYETTLRYLLAMALYLINPKLDLKISYYESRSLFGIILNGNFKVDDAFIKIVDEKMMEIVKQNYPLKKKIVSNEEAKEIYQRFNMEDKIELLKYRPEKTVHFYECNGYFNYMYGYMTPTIGYIKKWKLIYHDETGFLIQYPRYENNGEIPSFKPSPTYSKTLDASYEWAKMVGTDTVTKINHHVEESGDVDFINLCEAHHNNMLSDLGRVIRSKIDQLKLICIAGPSSSGKTTFANRLRSELLSYGLKVIRISLDDYYLPKEQAPLNSDGSPDLESLDALDVPLFNDNMEKLIHGETVTLPHYNFQKGGREEGRVYKLEKNEIIIIEGIHALNEKLTYRIPRNQKYKIYISPQEQINLDNHNPVSLTNLRLIRRIVRDYRFRNASCEETLSMWPSVRRGEFKWIYETQEGADFVFNSLLFYEHCVLKDDALAILKQVNKDSPYYIQANRLIKYIKYFLVMDDKWVPCNSILQEFIGHSCYQNVK